MDFSKVEVDERPVKVYPRVKPQVEQRLISHVKKIDPGFKPDQCRAEDLRKMSKMPSWMDIHCRITPYSFIIQRCGDVQCCGVFRSPTENGIRDLAMQLQPTPRLDPTRKGHYYRREDALRLFGEQDKSCVDLTDLPSKNNEKKREKDKKSQKVSRDKAVSASLCLRSWDPKKVFAIVKCFHCGKPRTLFTPKKEGREFKNARNELVKRLESISHMYSCGDLIFKDDEQSGKVISQRSNLSCESPVEKSYYNIAGRSLKTADICIHCAAEGSSEFILGQKQLEELNKTGGKECYPICKVCFEAGKQIVNHPKKKATQSQKRREDAASKISQAQKRRKN